MGTCLHLLGFVLATVAIQALKTAATAALIFPLIVLAVPILDTSSVIAKRLKYGAASTEPTPWHPYHWGFRNIGFTHAAAIYFYIWGSLSRGGALATRFVPFRSRGEWHLWPTVLVATIALLVAATSPHVVYVLEILSSPVARARAGRRQADEPDQEQRLKSATPRDYLRGRGSHGRSSPAAGALRATRPSHPRGFRLREAARLPRPGGDRDLAHDRGDALAASRAIVSSCAVRTSTERFAGPDAHDVHDRRRLVAGVPPDVGRPARRR